MEVRPVVCYSTGTMNSVLDKLTKLKNHSDPTDDFSVRSENLKKDLLGLKEDFCDKVAWRWAKDKQVKVCMKQVRELVFEIEDWIDQRPETNMLDPSSIQDIEYFKTEIMQARRRFTWYYDLLKEEPTEPDLVVSAPSKIPINPRLLIEEKPCHGLLDGTRDDLLKHLTDKKEEMLKVVSVVGMEGLGKTTLAKEIFSELQLRRLFECQAFVSVGPRTPMREILNDILRQIIPGSRIFQDVQRIITQLREYLCTKRYFVLVDGIWSEWAWKIINCALPNNRGSRVLITTCIIDVAESCCSYPNDLVYRMEALSEKNSTMLFLSKITLEKEEKGADFEEISGNMLNMCGGMPLAITVAAGLLARKSEELAELKMIGKSIHSSVKQYSTSEGMTKILHMSYADLSLPLRTCFLYLGIFQEKYTITKDRLIWLWGAEGFIPRKDEEYLWVTGEMFFNELISRRLIQPVFDYDVDVQAVGCTIQGVILDFIRSLSREENFAMTAAELQSGPFPCDRIRRFSLDCGNEDEAVALSTSSMHLSSMRSLIVFGTFQGVSEDDEEMYDHPSLSVSGDDEGMFDDLSVSEDDDPSDLRASMINLPAFKLLQVLDLEDTCNLKEHHLEGIGGLVLLRYLGLGRTGIDEIPKDMGELEQLETLDLRLNGLITFPASIVKLQKLKHLLLQVDGTEIWEMPELEVASDIRVESSSSLVKVIELLRKSERLRILGLTLKTSTPTETDLVPFLDEVVKSKLQSLSLYWDYRRYETLLVDSWEKVTAPPANKFEPRRFELKISISPLKRVPPNMGSLASLTHLHMCFVIIRAPDFLVLGGLTNLVLLNLSAMDCHIGGRFIINKGIFHCLKAFSFKLEERWMGLEFEEGAMPQLQMLGRGFRVSERGNQAYSNIQDIGIEHLTCLTRVHINFNCQDATVSELEAAEAAIRGKISEIATKPTLKLSRKNEYIMKKDKQEQHTVQVTADIKKRVYEMYNKRKLQFIAPAKVSEKYLSTVYEDEMKDQEKQFISHAKEETTRTEWETRPQFFIRCGHSNPVLRVSEEYALRAIPLGTHKSI